jgi:hypothetical protein
MAIFLFPLPFVEVCCRGQNLNVGTGVPKPKTSITDWIYGLFPQPELEFPILTQSGLQAALGQCSWAAALEKDKEIERKEMKQKLDSAMKGSPLMILYPVLLAVGVICGSLLPLKKPRLIILVACSGSALILLIVQTIVGFPIQGALAIVAPGSSLHLRYTFWYGLALLAHSAVLLIAAMEWRRQLGIVRDPTRFFLLE